MADIYTGDIEYSPGRLSGGSWYCTLYKNKMSVDNHRSYTRIGGLIWLWYEAKSWAHASKARKKKDAKSIKGIQL